MSCRGRMHKKARTLLELLDRARTTQSGQVLPVMLAIMAVVALITAPSLSYLGTGLKSGKLVEQHVEDVYAADSGIEHGLWTLRNFPPSSYPYTYQLSGINGMPVNVTLSVNNVLWGFALGGSGVHANWLLLHASMVWDPSQNNYLYTVTLTNTSNSNIHMDYIMVTPPTGYSYVSGSAYGITTANPEVAGDPNGNMGMLWDFDTPMPDIPKHSTVSQYFRLSGPAGYTGSPGYIWASAEPQDIGTIGTATAMKVTAQAMRGGVAAATASALALVDNTTGAILVGSWQLN